AVEVPVGEDLGDRERMRDVRVARLARLAGVGGLGEAVGLGEAGDVLRLQVAEALGAEEFGCCRHGVRLPDPKVLTRSGRWASSRCASGPRCRSCRWQSRA